jgi:hypothetical protein
MGKGVLKIFKIKENAGFSTSQTIALEESH